MFSSWHVRQNVRKDLILTLLEEVTHALDDLIAFAFVGTLIAACTLDDMELIAPAFADTAVRTPSPPAVEESV